MSLRSMLHTPAAIGAACGAVFLAFVSVGGVQRAAQAASGPFADLAGAWSGGGTIVATNGSNERIRCRVTYTVANDGNNLRQDLRCASDSYRFDLTANVSHRGGSISGQWAETSRNAGGTVSGRVRGGEIEALVEGSGFSAVLSVSTHAGRQSVSIRPRGIEVTEVTMTLRKGSR